MIRKLTANLAVDTHVCSAFNTWAAFNDGSDRWRQGRPRPQQIVGSLVVKPRPFLDILLEGIRAHDTSKDRAPGQHFITLPSEAHLCVSPGDAARSDDPSDFLIWNHRGVPTMFQRRWISDSETTTRACAAIVYTLSAYKADPETEVDALSELHFDGPKVTHILVAVLASCVDRPPPLTPERLAANLAGGNREAALWTADEIRIKAIESVAFWNKYAVVCG